MNKLISPKRRVINVSDDDRPLRGFGGPLLVAREEPKK